MSTGGSSWHVRLLIEQQRARKATEQIVPVETHVVAVEVPAPVVEPPKRRRR